MIILSALLAAIALLALCSLNWRVTIKTVLYVVVLEGALRKWVLPQASEFIYFLKDGMLLGAYIGYFTRERAPLRTITTHGALLALVSVAAFIIFAQALNPSLNSTLVGLLGVKQYLIYVPLAVILPDLFRSSEELHRFLRWYLLFCIPVCLLGIVQFFAPADSFLNVYAPSEVEVQVVTFEEGNVRITGTFPFLGGFTAYLTLVFALVFALLVHQSHWHWRAVLGVALLLIVPASFMTGARAIVLSAVILAIGFCLYSILETTGRNRRLAFLLIPACAVCGVATVKVFPKATEAFLNRASDDTDSVSQRIGNTFIEPLFGAQYSGIGGYGAGSTQVVGYALRERLRLPPPINTPPPSEGDPLRVMYELGVFGFIAWYGLRIYFLCMLWLTTRKLRQPMLRHLALAAFLYHALLINGQLITNTTTGILYWFLAGFAFLLPRLDQVTPQARKVSRRTLRPGKSVDARNAPAAVLQ